MLPVLVKNRDTSLPWSARRAMVSADTDFRCLRVLFVESLLLPSGLLESDKVVIFALPILAYFKNNGVQVFSHPADRAVLLGPIRALIEVVRMRKDFLPLFEPDPPFGVCS